MHCDYNTVYSNTWNEDSIFKSGKRKGTEYVPSLNVGGSGV